MDNKIGSKDKDKELGVLEYVDGSVRDIKFLNQEIIGYEIFCDMVFTCEVIQRVKYVFRVCQD